MAKRRPIIRNSVMRSEQERVNKIIGAYTRHSIEQFNAGKQPKLGLVDVSMDDVAKELGYTGAGGISTQIKKMINDGLMELVSKSPGAHLRNTVFDMSRYVSGYQERMRNEQKANEQQVVEVSVQTESNKNHIIKMQIAEALSGAVEFCKSLAKELDEEETSKQVESLKADLSAANQEIHKLEAQVQQLTEDLDRAHKDASRKYDIQAHRMLTLYRGMKDDITIYNSKPNWQKFSDETFMPRLSSRLTELIRCINPDVFAGTPLANEINNEMDTEQE